MNGSTTRVRYGDLRCQLMGAQPLQNDRNEARLQTISSFRLVSQHLREIIDHVLHISPRFLQHISTYQLM